jgi:RNA polymerase sigma factor (sigma-70 family)
MAPTAERDGTVLDQDLRIADVVRQEGSRLRRFIARRVPDPSDAEDILQDVFSALVEANRLLMPVEHLTGWLFRAARNRIIDVFRKRTPELLADLVRVSDEDELDWEALLPSPDGGPEAELLRSELFDALEAALAALPAEQRHVFVAHELEGRSYQDLAAETGVNVNTLLSRKRYAVRRLRAQLRHVFDALET